MAEMMIGFNHHGKWQRYIKPHWMNTITYKEAGCKIYKWLCFYISIPLKGGQQ